MRKIIIAIAVLAMVGFIAPTVQSANAETVIIKKGGDHRDHGRDWGHHHDKKVVVIKHRGDRRD